jgi:hypothetical protein
MPSVGRQEHTILIPLLLRRILQLLQPVFLILLPRSTPNIHPAQQLVRSLDLRASHQETCQILQILGQTRQFWRSGFVPKFNAHADAFEKQIVPVSRVALFKVLALSWRSRIRQGERDLRAGAYRC